MFKRKPYNIDSLNSNADSALGCALHETIWKDGKYTRLDNFTAEEVKETVSRKERYKTDDPEAFDDAFLNYYVDKDVASLNKLGHHWLIQAAHKKGKNEGLIKGIVLTATGLAFAGFIAARTGILEMKINDFEHKTPAKEIKISDMPADSVKNIPTLQLK